MSQYLHLINYKSSPTHQVTNPAVDYSFPLDPFQQHAIAAIDQGHNVLVCAKTGSGKTLVGEYQIHNSLRKGKRVFYTTPIKSLSNQKFYDLKHQFPSVGIMTGDIKFCPDAQIVIMTTEILRNLLYKRGTQTEHLGLTASLSIDDLDAVIFDECHYINDRDRGKVWEETMILLPPEVNLVMLSATLDRPQFFAAWLGDLKKKPIHLIETEYRIVPLVHTLPSYTPDGLQFTPFMDAKEVYYDKVYLDWTNGKLNDAKAYKDFRDKVRAIKADGEHVGGVEGKVRPVAFTHQMNNLIQTLQERELCPALFFVLSRKGCEHYAAKVEGSLITPTDSTNVKHIINFHLHRYKSLETLPQYHQIRDLLLRGIAFHHSGLLPLLKEIVEILFTKGLVKVLFATETFAVGLNMPTKTVVFTGLKKYDDTTGGMRLLRPDEYTQMAGRAGRRGKDTSGLVIYMPDRDALLPAEMRQIMRGNKPPIHSRMSFNYEFLLKTLQSESTSWLEIMKNSYWFEQLQGSIRQTENEITAAEAKIAALDIKPNELEDCKVREYLEARCKTTVNAARKEVQRSLDHWKNKHLGPRWDTVWKAYSTQYKKESLHLEDLQRDLAQMKRFDNCIYPVVKFLYRTNFLQGESEKEPHELTKQDLSLKGILATEVNEAHPILLPQIYLEKLVHDMDAKDIVTFLSIFLEDNNKEETISVDELQVPENIKRAIHEVEVMADGFRDVETVPTQDYWKITTQWAEPIHKWLEGEHIAVICKDYNIFEGNFIRGLLKMGNIVDEWIALATFCEHTEQIDKLTGIKAELIRDVVQPESLYLRM